MKNWVILCVDDEKIILKTLKRELNETLGRKYSVETATRGEDALQLFEDLIKQGYEIPVVIADHIMPGMKGTDLLASIHALSPATLKIMLTGQADKEAVISALNHAELYRYIAKPWEKIDLILTVKEALRRYLQEKKLKHQNQLLRNINNTLEMKVKGRTAQIEAQKLELKKLNAGKDEFFSIIAHDLRTPFSGLLGITDVILKNIEQVSQKEIKENLEILKNSAETVYTLLENLLTWSRLQRGIMEHHPETICLDESAEHNTRLFASTAEQKQITLANQIPQGLKAYADKNMIDTVMRNLISNALKFTHPGGIIAISAHQNETSVEFSVSDTGIGIPQEDLPQLFRIDERYSNVGTAGEEGTGVGLILCKDLVEKNGGKIWVESEVGYGTIFTIHLRVAEKRNSPS